MTSLSIPAIQNKISETFLKISSPPSPKNITIEEVTKLRNNGIVVLFGTKEVADWLQDSEADLTFTAALSSGVSIRLCQHIILVPKIPITLDPDNDTHIREIKEANCLKDHTITKI
jgi:hypothetical protein